MQPGYTCPQTPDPIKFNPPTVPASYDALFRFPTRTAQNLQQIQQPGSVSCRVRIPLQRDYSNVVLNDADANRLNSPFVPILPTRNALYAVVNALYLLNDRSGNTLSEIIAEAQTVSSFTNTELLNAIQVALSRGLLSGIPPNSWNPTFVQPEVRYSFWTWSDRDHRNKNYITFLLQLVGGIGSDEFTQWFDYYCKRPCMSQFFTSES